MASLCLVPTRLRASRAARRLCDAQDGLLFGPRVLTPDELVPGLLAASGDRRALLTPLAEQLLARDAGRLAGCGFAEPASGRGLGRALASAIRELREAEVTSADAERAAAGLEGRAGARLAELARALAAYERRLRELRVLDRAAGLRAAAEALRRGVCSEETRDVDLLAVEGFHAPAPAEWDVLAALARRASRTQVRLPYFPERPDLSGPAEPMLRRLEALHDVAADRDVQLVLSPLDPGPERAARLCRVLRAIAGGSAGDPGGPQPEAGRVIAAAGAGERGEVEGATRIAAALLAEGYAAEDVVFIAAAPSRSAPLLARACAEHGVPFAAGRGAPLAELPPVAAVRNAIAAAPALTRAAAERLGSSTYLGLPSASRLSFWLDRAGAFDGRNDPEEALRARARSLVAAGASRERAALGRAADALSALRERLRPLSAPAAGREWARRLQAFVAAQGIRRRAARGEPDLARRDLGALTRLEDVADELAEALSLVGHGAEPLAPAEYLALLEVALEGATTPGAPEPAAGAVELWPLSESPGLTARAAILVGCGRGTFPPGARPEALLREPERRAVNAAVGHAALATAGARRAEGDYLAFSALAAAREALALVWAAPGPDGEGLPPAPLVLEALAACGLALPAPAADPELPAARTAAEALRASARLHRAGAGAAALSALDVAEVALGSRARSAFARGELDSERRAAVLARRATPASGQLPDALAAMLAEALPREWTPSQLERFANCPFQLFLELVLRLPDREAADLDIDPRDEGFLTHAVLERFLEARRARGAWPLDGGEADRNEAREVAARLFARFEAEGRVGDPSVWAARRETILWRLDRVVEAEARDHDGLVPALLEHRFGGPSGRPPLAFEDGGETVLLQGRIDRVDAGGDRLLVIDYKNSRNARDHAEKLEPEALGVTSFQLPAYLLAAARELPGRSRLLATYALVRSAERLEPVDLPAGDGFLALDPEKRAEVRAAGGRTFADEVLAAVRRIRRGELPIAARDCTHCPYGAVCRFQSAAEGDG